MPQMSPLGWSWIVLVVVLGYSLVMMLCYYKVLVSVFFVSSGLVGDKIFWEW